MDRGWYARFLFVFTMAVLAWFALWPSLEQWLPAPQYVEKYFGGKISPGLDIRGGLRLMYEVEVDEAVRDRRNTRAEQLLQTLGERMDIVPEGETPTREQLAEIRERVDIDTPEERRIALSFDKSEDVELLDRELINRYGDLKELSRSGNQVTLAVKAEFLEDITDTAVQQARETIMNRIDALGLRETAVTAQGTDIIVEVPGAGEETFDHIRDIISKTARLEFKVVADESDAVSGLNDLPEGIEKQTEIVSAGEANPQVASQYLVARGKDARQRLKSYVESLEAEGKLPEGQELLLGRLERADDEEPEKQAGQEEKAWRTYTLYERAELTGQVVQDAFVSNDPQTNKPYVALNFDSEGADLFEELTGRNVKRRMAIVLDDRVESAPVIQTRIGGGRAQITLGGYRDYNQLLNEAKDLVIVLKAGALPVPIRPANEQLIGPTLGRDAVQKGARGGLVGVGLVLLFMLIYYQVAGIIADVMVMLNLLFLLAVLALFEATLTLPGLVGIALTMGMAVDANVLITERIREEVRNGKSPRAAVDQGYARAFWAIIDSQFTTFLAGVVLFQYGTGPIKGFAVTLMIGICTSLFTGVFCSRVFFDWVARGLRVQQLKVG